MAHFLTILLHKPDGTAEVNDELRGDRRTVHDWLGRHTREFLGGGLRIGERAPGKLTFTVPPQMRGQCDVERVSILHNLPA